MGRPSGMPYADDAGELRRDLRQIINPHGVLAHLNASVRHSDAARVIAAILQLPQTVEEYGQRLPITDVTDYSTHAWKTNLLLEFMSALCTDELSILPLP